MKSAALFFVLLLISATIAFAQDGRNRPSDRSERLRNRDEQSEIQIDTGYVFLDGNYLFTPYHVSYTGTHILIGDTRLELALFKHWDTENKGGRHGSRDKKAGTHGKQDEKAGPQRLKSRQFYRLLVEKLERDDVIVIFTDQRAELFPKNDSYDLLKTLIDDQARSAFTKGKLDWIPTEVDHDQWISWIAGYVCPDELRKRASARIAQVDELVNEHDTKIAARATLDVTTYPLTVTGMVLVVLAIGHLLSFKPTSEGDAEISPQTDRGVRRALLLLTSLSALDLVWTILVSRTGAMKELNPIGAALIHDPQSLIALKVSATGLAIGILFVFRQHRVAQHGAWWGCLICTLLTVRWLAFTSMFV